MATDGRDGAKRRRVTPDMCIAAVSFGGGATESPEGWVASFVDAVRLADHEGAERIVCAGIPLRIRQTTAEAIRERLESKAGRPLLVVGDDGQSGLVAGSDGQLVVGDAAGVQNPPSTVPDTLRTRGRPRGLQLAHYVQQRPHHTAGPTGTPCTGTPWTTCDAG